LFALLSSFKASQASPIKADKQIRAGQEIKHEEFWQEFEGES
jgi:hypothetical protein